MISKQEDDFFPMWETLMAIRFIGSYKQAGTPLKMNILEHNHEGLVQIPNDFPFSR